MKKTRICLYAGLIWVVSYVVIVLFSSTNRSFMLLYFDASQSQQHHYPVQPQQHHKQQQQHEQNEADYPDDDQALGSRPVSDRVQGSSAGSNNNIVNNYNSNNNNINNNAGISFHVKNNNTDEATLLKKKMLDEFKAMLPHTDHQHEKHNGQGWSLYLKYKDTPSRRLWPHINDQEDRILHQIHRVPKVDKSRPMKVIFMPNGLDADMVEGQQRFLDHQCPINWCLLTDDLRYKKSADLIFHRDVIIDYGGDVIKGFGGSSSSSSNSSHSSSSSNSSPCIASNQITMLFMLESPMHTMTFHKDQVVNWTATYRTDSTLNAPYERFTPFSNFTKLPDKPDRNYAKGKTKKVAWFVSNCVAANGRSKYAELLAQHINVDIYGSCGQLSCTRYREQECFQMLQKDYKFYLSFENSNCKDYITEKFFLNALGNNVLPIVMGARPSDYKRLAPPESFIHVDDFESPKHLAEYLHKLDKDDDLYNSYFRWKGTGEFIDTKFWCRLCSMLHEQTSTNTRSWYKLEDWWRGTGVCISPQDSGLWWSSWRHSRISPPDMHGTYQFIPGNKHFNQNISDNNCHR